MPVVTLMSTGNLFHAFGPATEKACSEDKKINPVQTVERNVARPGMSATEVINSAKYDGARLVDGMVHQNIEFEIYSL